MRDATVDKLGAVGIISETPLKSKASLGHPAGSPGEDATFLPIYVEANMGRAHTKESFGKMQRAYPQRA